MMAIFGKFFLVFNVFLTISAYTLTNCGWKVQVFYGEKFPFTEYNELMEVILDELCYVTPDTDKFIAFAHGDDAAEQFIESYEYENNKESYFGIFFLGTTTPRRFWKPENTPLEIPTFVMIGDLDGVTRVTRIGEEIYHSNGNSKVAIVVGGNHMGFVRSPEKWPQNGDLTCEISKAEYIEEISTTFVAWVSFLTTGIDSGNILAAQATRVANIIKPSIDGFELENSFYYQAPKQIGPNWDPDLCPTVWVGDRGLCEEEASSWGIFAQRYVSGFEPAETSELAQLGFQYDVDGYMAALSSRPSFKCGGCLHHLPDITVNENEPMVLKNTIFTQMFWDANETYASAWTLDAKLYSRQCTYIKSGVLTPEEADYDELDGDSFCQEINQIAWDNAIKELKDSKTLERFEKYGVPYKMMPDKVVIAGPSWLEFGLNYTESYNEDILESVEVTARTLKTPYAFPVFEVAPDPRCYHYCHLLSPARIMEYIYTDSLRYNLGIQI